MKPERVFDGEALLRADAALRVACEVAVIGTGCGGASLAARLAEAGRDVILLEQGGYYTKADFDQREANMLAKIDGGRGLDTASDGGVSLTYGNCVGGASVHYWADSYRLPADRLALWEERYGLQGHGAALLDAHFAEIEAELHVHPAGDAYANPINLKVRDAGRALGWKVERVPQARQGCLSSGYCHQGCAYDAKQSQLVTAIPRALAAGARLYADVRATQLHWQGRRVVGLEGQVLDRATGRSAGVALKVEAAAVVVAAGGYGTPAFLLAQGLKAQLPALGEHLFVNPCPMVHARFDEEIVQWRNIPAAWCVEEFRVARHDRAKPGVQTGFFGDEGEYLEGGYLLMPNQLQPALLAAVLPGAGPAHRALMRELPRIGGTIAWVDDAEPGRLSWELAARRVHVPLTGGNRLRIRDAFLKQGRLLLQAGAAELLFGDAADTRVTRARDLEAAVAALDLRPSRNLFAAPHPGGAARMGASEAGSVVGFDHRVHGFDNLYVADPSVFPTAPSVDPSLTILAFSRVAADAVHANLG